jgi:hypothetical protein
MVGHLSFDELEVFLCGVVPKGIWPNHVVNAPRNSRFRVEVLREGKNGYEISLQDHMGFGISWTIRNEAGKLDNKKLVMLKRSDGTLHDALVRPTLNIQYLFYFFLDTTTCDALVGDLNERYKIIFTKFGKFRADLWYWKEAIRSVAPVAWGGFKKLVMKPAIAVGSWMLGHGLLKDSSMMETLKQIVVEWLQKMRG